MYCTILVTNFQKSPSAGGSPPPPALLNLQYWWPEVPWFGQIVVLKLIMTKSNFKNAVMTSFQWRHHHYVTEKRHQNTATNFFQFGLLSIKISGYASERLLYFWLKLHFYYSAVFVGGDAKLGFVPQCRAPSLRYWYSHSGLWKVCNYIELSKPKTTSELSGFFFTLHVERQRGILWIPISNLSLEIPCSISL